MGIPDYYKILNIQKSASSDEIKKAYRRMALKYHPDVNKSPDAHEKFILINEAYQILSNNKLRIEYDKQYEKYYKEEGQPFTSGDIVYHDLIKNHKEKAKEKAEHYAKMNFNEFRKELYRYLKLTGILITFSIIKATAFVLTIAGIVRLIMGFYFFELHLLVTGTLFCSTYFIINPITKIIDKL